MGLFDAFNKSNKVRLTTPFIFVASMIYMSTVDGHLDESEVMPILNLLGTGHAPIVLGRQAILYSQRTPVAQFIQEAGAQLDANQKACILANMLDVLFGDGYADHAERQLFEQFCTGWGVDESVSGPLIRAAVTKNNRSIILG
ncbi:MAG: hypothetical protein CMH57_02655 [Myxococcales bacterium]|nr:hypothetical protein [Myxococcales bacterium]